MLTTDLGACEWFVWDLRRSNLIDRGQLDQVIGEFLNKNPGAEPPALARVSGRPGHSDRLPGRAPAAGQDARLRARAVHAHGRPGHRQHGHGVQGAIQDRQRLVRRQGAAAAQHVERPHRPPQGARLRAVQASRASCRSSTWALPAACTTWPGPSSRARPSTSSSSARAGSARSRPPAMPCKPPRDWNYAIKQGLFHGLLKPSNLMLGGDGQVRILDFGIGCLLAETEGESLVDTMSTANSVNSGLDCASPESIMDPTNLTPIGDQYSLGCVLYYCLTGRYPFPDGTAVEKMMSHQHKQPTADQRAEPRRAGRPGRGGGAADEEVAGGTIPQLRRIAGCLASLYRRQCDTDAASDDGDAACPAGTSGTCSAWGAGGPAGVAVGAERGGASASRPAASQAARLRAWKKARGSRCRISGQAAALRAGSKARSSCSRAGPASSGRQRGGSGAPKRPLLARRRWRNVLAPWASFCWPFSLGSLLISSVPCSISSYRIV